MALLRRDLFDFTVKVSRRSSSDNSAVTKPGLEHFERQAEGFH